MTIYLKFPDEAAFAAAIADHLVDGSYPAYIGAVAVDVVGVIHKPTGEVLDTEDGPVPVIAPLPGWHVNLSAPVAFLAAWQVRPAHPSVSFFKG